ncbi:hypothetical protein RND81_05G223300 [Saponaria officinalis]|uniref:Xyloglucan endotransglucosylase/hydrolase n=1 Tax=Saponaria officinalis TaxID=3572 RepID=A0AAW1KZK7_SAPOF
MDHPVIFVVILFFVFSIYRNIGASESNFDEYYYVVWGNEHVIRNRSTIVQLYMDEEHGGAGFESRHSYGSGFFKMRIKLPGKEAAGVVTAYYLTSGNSHDHDELDFEFLGNRAGKLYTLQTNVFVDGHGDREQRITLWFDPTAHFHTYQLLWNPYHIVFYVDDIPIREYKNNKKYGAKYPSQAMKIEASLWNGEDWATDGGKTKTNWTCAPFRAFFDDFAIDGCSSDDRSIGHCSSADYWWNNQPYRVLNASEKQAYKNVKNRYLNYDYCTDKSRHPTPPPECNHQ